MKRRGHENNRSCWLGQFILQKKVRRLHKGTAVVTKMDVLGLIEEDKWIRFVVRTSDPEETKTECMLFDKGQILAGLCRQASVFNVFNHKQFQMFVQITQQFHTAQRTKALHGWRVRNQTSHLSRNFEPVFKRRSRQRLICDNLSA